MQTVVELAYGRELLGHPWLQNAAKLGGFRDAQTSGLEKNTHYIPNLSAGRHTLSIELVGDEPESKFKVYSVISRAE